MLTVGPWRETPRPPDADTYAASAWDMAAHGSSQHPQAVRALWDGDRPLALGGVVAINPAEGYAFYWSDPAMPRRGWRLIWNTVHSIVWWAHERGLRVVTAMVVASHVEGHRLIRRMGFEPYGPAPGFAGQAEPMLRYLHIWPAIEEPALVGHQRRELHRAAIEAWCPNFLRELDGSRGFAALQPLPPVGLPGGQA